MSKKGKERMNSSVVGIELGEKESVATYLLPAVRRMIVVLAWI